MVLDVLSPSGTTNADTPEPPQIPQIITVQELHELIHSTSEHQRDFVIVDVRRTDIEGDMGVAIPGAINLPAQTFQATVSAIAGVLFPYKKVLFYCSSSNGRGPRCAGWYQAELDRKGEVGSAAWVIKGGMKAWKECYGDELVQIAQ